MNAEVIKQLEVFLMTSNYAANLAKRSIIGKTKESPMAIFAAQTFYNLFKAVKEWPIQFLYVYLDDSLGNRHWVDSTDPLVSLFCKNILASLSIKCLSGNL